MMKRKRDASRISKTQQGANALLFRMRIVPIASPLRGRGAFAWRLMGEGDRPGDAGSRWDARRFRRRDTNARP